MDEQLKYEVIKSLADHPDTGNKDRAALKLGCTRRHINRMIAGYRREGRAFFIHGNRGRKPSTSIADSTRRKITDLYSRKYSGANFTHYTELLSRFEDIHVSPSSVRNILEAERIFSPKITKNRRRRIRKELELEKEAARVQDEQHTVLSALVPPEDAHSRRPRCACFGEMEQMDATPYEWVENQIWHLHLAIDDALGMITGGWFDTQETLDGYYHVLYQILTEYGIPYKLFTDRRTVFTYKKKNAPSDDEDTCTQFAYACRQLGIDLESSSVPQAKGRVERLNQTLQSRLPVELRLAGITDISSANEFLHSYIKEFNAKFALPCNGIRSVFEVQPDAEKINLTLAVLTERTVDCGHAVQFRKHFYRMLDKNGMQVHYLKGTKVMVVQAFDSSMFCCVNDKDIYALEEIPERERQSKDLDADYKPVLPQKQYIPPMNHPWRRYAFRKFIHSQPHRIEDDIKSA